MMAEFTHIQSDGSAAMVDVGDKAVTKRIARARAFVRMSGSTLDLIKKGLLPKGDPFEAARIAGIMAAKKTSELIPLCHPLGCTYINIAIAVDESGQGIAITSEVRVEERTGAEMEALTGVSVAALTVYDMCKAVDKAMVIEGIELVEKSGGKSHYSKS